MISGKKILITGGAGFIGSNMANLLMDTNQITVLDDFSGGIQRNVKLPETKENLRIVRGDIRKRELAGDGLEGVSIGAAFGFALGGGVDTVSK